MPIPTKRTLGTKRELHPLPHFRNTSEAAESGGGLRLSGQIRLGGRHRMNMDERGERERAFLPVRVFVTAARTREAGDAIDRRTRPNSPGVRRERMAGNRCSRLPSRFGWRALFSQAGAEWLVQLDEPGRHPLRALARQETPLYRCQSNATHHHSERHRASISAPHSSLLANRKSGRGSNAWLWKSRFRVWIFIGKK